MTGKERFNYSIILTVNKLIKGKFCIFLQATRPQRANCNQCFCNCWAFVFKVCVQEVAGENIPLSF